MITTVKPVALQSAGHYELPHDFVFHNNIAVRYTFVKYTPVLIWREIRD